NIDVEDGAEVVVRGRVVIVQAAVLTRIDGGEFKLPEAVHRSAGREALLELVEHKELDDRIEQSGILQEKIFGAWNQSQMCTHIGGFRRGLTIVAEHEGIIEEVIHD